MAVILKNDTHFEIENVANEFFRPRKPTFGTITQVLFYFTYVLFEPNAQNLMYFSSHFAG